MARINPVPARELEICRRLRLARQATNLSRMACARELEIGGPLFSAYEHGRVPIRYEFADRFCKFYNVSQRWLADGIPPQHYYVFVERSMREKIPRRMRFSEAYDRFLRPPLEKHFNQIAPILKEAKSQADIDEIKDLHGPSIRAYTPEELLGLLVRMIRSLLEELPPHLYAEYYRAFGRAHREFCTRYMEEVHRHQDAVEAASVKNSAGKVLTYITQKSNRPPMQSAFAHLMRRLKKATQFRGKKVALAEVLGVPAPRISEWLGDKKKPNGETTLRLLEWVQTEEANQQKSPGGAIHTTRAKTRSNHPKHEKSKSSPP